MKALVIGAGVIGASVAFRLAEAGVAVTLIDAGLPCGGTSQVSFAWVSAAEKLASDPYFALSLAAVEEHRRLAEAFGPEGQWYPRPGVIQWQGAGAEGLDLGEMPIAHKLRQLAARNYPAETLARADLARLVPQLSADAMAEDGLAIHYPEDGYLDAPLYVGSLVAAARDRYGAQLLSHTSVAEVLVRSGRVAGVQTDQGDVIAADVVVNCAGRWANEVAGEAGLGVPQAPTVGLIAYTRPAPLPVLKVLRTPGLNVRSDGGGRLLLRANDIDMMVGAEDLPRPDHPAAQMLAERLWRLVPGLSGLPVEAVRIGIRPIPGDGLPAIGPVRGVDGYWLAVSHGGINISALVGRLLTAEIVEGRVDGLLAPYRPDRFIKAAA
ncbi:Glycine/D-amino acid oxidase [Devosia enhydra]|uniref:Glycine/D-amino acid oxidase n=1 Tax=Devosia enhydra TaxID=665118 RepID=A0A1K2I015_9HYPH|nr:FAD-dependent oxidoreductase [Devosia enhydra]SFZ85531.1 Glycine/D-amino acid oxidase [Devosia enhydra]